MEGKTILVVDDSPSVRETIAYLLAREGFEVHTAVNGFEGLEAIRRLRPQAVLLDAIRRLRPQAVLLDAMMPDIDGFDVCRNVKEDAEIAGTQIIMLTSMGQKADEVRAREAGVDAFLTKPPDIAKTIALIRNVCSAGEG